MTAGTSKFIRWWKTVNAHSHQWLQHPPCNTNVKVTAWLKKKQKNMAQIVSQSSLTQPVRNQRNRDLFTSHNPPPRRSQPYTPEDKNVCVSGNSREYIMALNSLALARTPSRCIWSIKKFFFKKKALKLHIFRRVEAKVTRFNHLVLSYINTDKWCKATPSSSRSRSVRYTVDVVYWYLVVMVICQTHGWYTWRNYEPSVF